MVLHLSLERGDHFLIGVSDDQIINVDTHDQLAIVPAVVYMPCFELLLWKPSDTMVASSLTFHALGAYRSLYNTLRKRSTIPSLPTTMNPGGR
jgi:hypothetical protein